MAQLVLDFAGKKDNSISFRASDRLKEKLEYLAKRLGHKSLSDLCAMYVIECASRDEAILEVKDARGEKLFVNIGSV